MACGMINARNYEYDCTRKCRQRFHASSITTALTKRSISDELLAAFVAKQCCNYADIVDDLGRSAVHLAASVGRYAILEWLINQGGIINGRDFESGSSPLHRAIYYGCIDCAVLLLRYGASLDLLDEDTRCPLQNVCRMRDFSQFSEVPASNELLVWGTNKNYNLGIDNDEGSNQPQPIDFFRKQHTSIAAVALGTYHSLFLDKKSQLFVVGHGKGGRLGTNNENSLPAPKRVRVPIKNAGESIVDISVSRNHSLLLTNRSAVFACGLNDDHQLGVRDAGDKLTAFREVVTLRDLGVEGLVRVLARDHYSAAYGEQACYVWGLNVGQFALDANTKSLPVPKKLKLPADTRIQLVEANNSAIAVLTKQNVIQLFYNGKVKSIKPPNFEAIKSISVIGGDTVKAAKGSAAALKLLLLTQTNVVYLWYEMRQSFYRCLFTAQLRLAQIDKIYHRGNQVLILSQGDVFRGKCTQVPVPAYMAESDERSSDMGSGIWSRCDMNRTEICREYMIRIELHRMTNIDRAVDIFCDSDLTSFAVLQESAYKYYKLPTITAEEYTFNKLYKEASESDMIHDVVFRVDGQAFAAHKLLIYARAPGLMAVVQKQLHTGEILSKQVALNYPGMSAKMFELMLRHVYTNQLPNEDDLDDVQHSCGPDSSENKLAVCRLFLEYVERFQLHNLAAYLTSCLSQDSLHLPQRPDKTKYRFVRLQPNSFPELQDLRIVCANDVELSAHKCILVARLEYFDMMFTHSWAEQTVINLSTVPVEYMRPILHFLYTADVEHFRKQAFSESFLYNMIVFCDQFFIERLRRLCEIAILDKITIRKCGEMLDFACMYNCEVLRRGCMDFICQNLARILSYRSLEQCEPDSLVYINAHYRTLFKDVFDYRMITPDAEAIEDTLLQSFVDDFQVDLNYRMDEQQEEAHRGKQKSQSSENKSQLAKRQYERDAISSMLESMQMDNPKTRHDSSSAVKDAQAVAQNLQAECKSWLKVIDKKDTKKRQSLDIAVKVNETLKVEKPKLDLAQMSVLTPTAHEKDVTSPTKSSGDDSPGDPSETTPMKVYQLNLSDFTPSREKLTQKQRKGLVSKGPTGMPLVGNAMSPATATKPVEVPAMSQPNAWGLVPQSPSAGASVTFSPPTTGSGGDPTSFANMMRGSAATSTSVIITSTENTFTQILADERKQRDYFERMRTKSLALTQIEETAIAELRDFYNVDNVTDEIITVERKPRPAATMNFAVWRH